MTFLLSVRTYSCLWSRAVAKNYPVCGFLSTNFAESAQFQHLLAGQSTQLAVKQQLQESFSVLHAGVSSKGWVHIPGCCLSLEPRK